MAVRIHEGRGSEVTGGTGRQRRGIELFEDGYFERISRNRFLVINPKRGTEHTVDVEKNTCSDCPDFSKFRHLKGFMCYHLIAANLYAEWLRQSTKVIAPIFGRVADDSGAA